MNNLNKLKTLVSSLETKLIYRRHITTTTTENPNPATLTANYLINSCGFSPEAAVLVSQRFKLSSTERADCSRVSKNTWRTMRHTTLKACQIIPCDTHSAFSGKDPFAQDRVLQISWAFKRECRQNFVFQPDTFVDCLEKRIIPTCNYLRSFGLSDKNLASVFKSGGMILLEGKAKNVEPNVALLAELGMSKTCISKLLAHFINCVTRRHERFREVVDDVRKMGFSMEKYGVFWTAIRAFLGKDSKLKMRQCRKAYMRKWGWTEDDVVSAFHRFPRCMIASEKKIDQLMDFVVNKMGLVSGREIARYPQILTFSIDKRVVPRCKVYRVLLSRGLLAESFSLISMMNFSEDKFLERFVVKYLDQVPQLMSLYQGKVDIKDL